MDTRDVRRCTHCGGPLEPAHGDGSVVARARHTCGVVRNLRRPRPDLNRPDLSRADLNRAGRNRAGRGSAERATLLYLVVFDHPAFGSLLAFGAGTPETVTDHLAGGALVRCVLRSEAEPVAAAARALRARYRPDAVGAIPGMPPSFGIGRDVVPAVLGVDPRDVLTGPAVTDVTHLFGPVRTRIVVGR